MADGGHHRKFSGKSPGIKSGRQAHAAGPLAPRRKKRSVKSEFGTKKRK